jgi:hypothetical protein
LLWQPEALWLVWVVSLLVFRRRPELRVGTPREFVYPVAALVIGLLWLFSTKSMPGSWFLALYMRAGVIAGVLLTAVWVISLLKRDTGIMDVAYPLAAAVPVVVLIALRGSWSPHEILTVVLVDCGAPACRCISASAMPGTARMAGMPRGASLRTTLVVVELLPGVHHARGDGLVVVHRPDRRSGRRTPGSGLAARPGADPVCGGLLLPGGG